MCLKESTLIDKMLWHFRERRNICIWGTRESSVEEFTLEPGTREFFVGKWENKLIQVYEIIIRKYIEIYVENWVESPVLYSMSLLVMYFIYSSVYLSIPVSQFIPPPLPSGNHNLFSTSVTLFLFCR